MECIPRCTQLLTTCGRSLGGKGGNDAHVYQPLSKTFVTALWNLGESLLTQFCLVALFFQSCQSPSCKSNGPDVWQVSYATRSSVTIVQLKRAVHPANQPRGVG